MNLTATRFATLMGSASILTLTTALGANAQEVAQAQIAPTLLTQLAQVQLAQAAPAQVAQAQMAQAAPEAVPEQVLVTGSLIHGAAAVGVPVTNLGVQDFTQSGNVTIGDLFRTVPQANVAPGPSATNSGGHQERETRVNIRGLDATGPRSLMMIDGIRFPPQADGLCAIDPSIIPSLALDRVDILADGASATYGSDAIAGVINVILKRGFDGATTLLHVEAPDAGGLEFQASQLYGRTWEGGDVTLTYEYINENPILATAHSKYTVDYTPWGLQNRSQIGSSIPGTISSGSPKTPLGVGVNCTNCFKVPAGAGANFNAGLNNGLGPLLPSSASTLDWASFSANAANMGTNVVDPLKMGWEQAAQQKNSMVATFDQRLFPGVSFFFTGFYSNRRVEELASPFYSQGPINLIQTFTVPTTNPYYPTNAPANLQVSYNLAKELPVTIPAYELSMRYSFGFNLDLPFGWTGQIYDSRSYDTNKYTINFVNDNAVEAALGSTDPSLTAGGIKPSSVPYLNLFCDPTAFRCNSPATLNYLKAQRVLGDVYQIEEKGGRFDGPIFDLPGGTIKAAVGGTYESDNVLSFTGNNSGGPPATPLTLLNDTEPYTVWAGFAQLDIPVFGDNFNLPLVRRLDLEASWRHDQYHGTLSGGTSNPKLAFTWLIDELVGATIRGSWGTSFRFANAGEYSTVASDAWDNFNFGGSTVSIACNGAAPNPGSAAAALFAAGFGCGSSPGGITWGGGPHPELRSYTTPAGQSQTREGGTALAPETSNNYSLGVELAPQFALLRGFDLQATYYSVKINGLLNGALGTTDSTLADPTQRYSEILPSDLGCPVAQNATPTLCAPFAKMAAAAISDRNSTMNLTQLSNVYFINDGGTFGSGFEHVSGIDFNASYDLDLGDLGAWNTGVTGTYYLHNFYQSVTGGSIIDLFHKDVGAAGGIAQDGVAHGTVNNAGTSRFIYRARLGWSDGPFSVTGFMNYYSHFFPTWPVPLNVNFQCTSAGGSVGGGSMPCAISNYSSVQPAVYTFDLSFGYNTGDMLANDYLKNITLQLTIQNLMGIHPAFEYGPSTSTRNAAGYNILQPDTGRVIGLTILKNW